MGVILDDNLNYESHIDHLCTKFSKQLGLLKHISPYLKRRQWETYFNGVIKPTFDVRKSGSVIWDCCSVESLTRVLKLQMRDARIILDTEKTTSSIFLFNILNWLPFTKESLIKRITLAFKSVNISYCTPSYLESLLVNNSDIHASRETRYSKFNVMS